MKKMIMIWTWVLGLVGSSGLWASDSLNLDWMLGCWESEDGSAREVWVRDSENNLIGFSVALRAGKLVFHEVLNIRKDDAGYHSSAHPSTLTHPSRNIAPVTVINIMLPWLHSSSTTLVPFFLAAAHYSSFPDRGLDAVARHGPQRKVSSSTGYTSRRQS